jgi:hypothetical protein
LASLISKLQKEKQLKPPRLIGVVHERLGTDEFRDFFPGGLLVLDADRNLFKAIGDNKASLFDMLRPSVWKHLSRAKSKGVEGNMKGDGMQLGGLLLIASSTSSGNSGSSASSSISDIGPLLFQYCEKEFGDHAPLDHLETLLRAHFTSTASTQTSTAAVLEPDSSSSSST